MGTQPMPARYTLYGTSGCHLCEQAQEMLNALCRELPDVAFETVDISASDTLFERYGLRIPVLEAPAGEQLDWPFELRELRRFLGG